MRASFVPGTVQGTLHGLYYLTLPIILNVDIMVPLSYQKMATQRGYVTCSRSQNQ